MYNQSIKDIVKHIITILPFSKTWSLRKYIIKDNFGIIYNATKFLPETASISERFYCILNDLTNQPKCRYCGSVISRFEYAKGYSLYCSHKCSAVATRDKVRTTCISKFGVDNPFKVKSIQEKCQSTNPFKTSTGQLLAKEARIKKYGVDYVNKFLCKGRTTNLNRYGYENAAKNEDIKIKMLERRFGTKLSCNIGKNEKVLLDKQEQIDNCIIDRSFIVGPYRPDGYCHESNTIYEVYEKHHRWTKHKQKDQQREEYIKEKLNCKFVIIWDL